MIVTFIKRKEKYILKHFHCFYNIFLLEQKKFIKVKVLIKAIVKNKSK